MFKIIENGQIIDVVESLKFVKCLPRSKKMILVDERQANGIMASNGNEVYHIYGTPYTFEEGKIYSILGRNGAGKTTLFNCMTKDVEFESGEMTLAENGQTRELAFGDIGLVSASPVLPEFLTGYEFVKFFMKERKNFYVQSKMV